MSTAWLHIIGVGERGPRDLSPAFKLLLNYAENVVGPARFLSDLEPVSRPGASGDLFNPELVTKRSFEAVARALAGDKLFWPSLGRTFYYAAVFVPLASTAGVVTRSLTVRSASDRVLSFARAARPLSHVSDTSNPTHVCPA